MTRPQTLVRPGADEYAPYYAGYVSRVPEGDALALLGAQLPATRRFVEAIGDARAGEPQAPGKWSVKDVVQHVADTERIMAYRALRIARGDTLALPGYEQDDYVRVAGAGRRPLPALLDELAAVRAASVALFDGLDAEALVRRGNANGNTFTPRALLYVILGHELHHAALLRDYFPSIPTATP